MSDHGPACACAQCMQRATTRQILDPQRQFNAGQYNAGQSQLAAQLQALNAAQAAFAGAVDRPPDPTTEAEAGKAPMHLVLGLPKALRALAMQLGHGARPPRSPGDWRRVPEHRQVYLAKILRHLLAYAEGHVVDESGQSHMAAVAADAMILIEREGEE